LLTSPTFLWKTASADSIPLPISSFRSQISSSRSQKNQNLFCHLFPVLNGMTRKIYQCWYDEIAVSYNKNLMNMRIVSHLIKGKDIRLHDKDSRKKERKIFTAKDRNRTNMSLNASKR
jgi:hypothetical protein